MSYRRSRSEGGPTNFLIQNNLEFHRQLTNQRVGRSTWRVKPLSNLARRANFLRSVPITSREMPKMSIVGRLVRQLSESSDLKPFQSMEYDR